MHFLLVAARDGLRRGTKIHHIGDKESHDRGTQPDYHFTRNCRTCQPVTRYHILELQPCR